MKKLSYCMAACCMAVFLAGCPSMPSDPNLELAVPTNLSEAGQQAAKIINNAKVALITAKNTVATRLSQGLMTKADAITVRGIIDDNWRKVKLAEGYLSSGQDVLAKQQADLLEQLMSELEKQLLARTKKGSA